MLERTLDRVTGRVSIALHERAARRLPELVERLMMAALERWAANGWHTFDHLEVIHFLVPDASRRRMRQV